MNEIFKKLVLSITQFPYAIQLVCVPKLGQIYSIIFPIIKNKPKLLLKNLNPLLTFNWLIYISILETEHSNFELDDSLSISILNKKQGYLNNHTCETAINTTFCKAWDFDGQSGLVAVFENNKMGFINYLGN